MCLHVSLPADSLAETVDQQPLFHPTPTLCSSGFSVGVSSPNPKEEDGVK